MNQLLQESRNQLLKPLSEIKMTYLIIFNIFNALLTISFMISGKVVSGKYVLAEPLMYTYIASIILSFFTALFNFFKLADQQGKAYITNWQGIQKIVRNKKLDTILSYTCVILILSMSVGGILGYGNKSSDSLITNFSFAHAMIISTVLIIGRKGAILWGFFVIGALFYNVSSLGWDYEYHYLTPTEVKQYKADLAAHDHKALQRKAELENHRLSPPSAIKYFRLWIIFISISILIAYVFGGVVNKVVATIPTVVTNIDESIQSGIRMNSELQQKQFELEQKKIETTKAAMKVVRYNDLIASLNKEIDKLEYPDKKRLSEVSNTLKRVINQEQDWEEFSINFDTTHSNFFKIVQEKYPELSHLEVRHLAFLKMNMTNEDIAKQLGVKGPSLRVLRTRLKKKLTIPPTSDLKEFLDSLET